MSETRQQGGELTPEDFVELCAKMKALGVQGFKFSGCEVAFYEPPPPMVEGRAPIETTPGDRTDSEEGDGTQASRRARIRQQIAAESKDLFASS